MTPAIQLLDVLAIASLTTGHLVQLVLAATLPLGAVWVLGKPEVVTVTWHDMLHLAGVLVIPMTVILGMRGLLTSEIIAGVVGVMVGHVVTFVDTD